MYVYSAEALSLWMTDPLNGQLIMLIVYWNCLIYQQPNLQNPFFATYNKTRYCNTYDNHYHSRHC